jgi:serine/threonine-protein kinase RsbW
VDVKLCLVFPREAVSVPVMRHMLGDALRALGADDQALGDLLLAVTEACTNVVRHGGPGRRYEVVARAGRGGCRVEVLDTGRGPHQGRLAGVRLRRPGWPPPPAPQVRAGGGRPALRRPLLRPARPFSTRPGLPEAAPASDQEIAALPESGRGLEIMRACVDDVTLRSRPEHGTVVTLRKRIAWRPGGPFADDDAGQLGELADAG